MDQGVRLSSLSKEEWMAQTDEVISQITTYIARNGPTRPLFFHPHLFDEITKKVINLGFKDFVHFCEHFNGKFTVDDGMITLLEKTNTPLEQSVKEKLKKPESDLKKNKSKKANIDDETLALLANYNPVPPSLRRSSVKETTNEPLKGLDYIHFKFAHEGKTRRFVFPRDDSNLVDSVLHRVQTIMGERKTFLYWQDDESLIVLECGDDMLAAIDFAEKQKNPPCIVIEATIEKNSKGEEKKEEKKIVTNQESSAAFNGFAFMCDECDCYLSSANGGRFKCIVCDDYDLCAACVGKGVHDNHAFIRLLNSETIVPLADEKGAVRNVQLMNTRRCTPSFVAMQKYDKPTTIFPLEKKFKDLIDAKTAHIKAGLNHEELLRKENWEKVKLTWQLQQSSVDRRRKEREIHEEDAEAWRKLEEEKNSKNAEGERKCNEEEELKTFVNTVMSHEMKEEVKKSLDEAYQEMEKRKEEVEEKEIDERRKDEEERIQLEGEMTRIEKRLNELKEKERRAETRNDEAQCYSSPTGSDIEILEIPADESDSVLDMVLVPESRLAQLLLPDNDEFTVSVESTLAAPAAAERFKSGPAAAAAATRRELVARLGTAAIAAGPVQSVCSCGKTVKEDWPSVRWMMKVEELKELDPDIITSKFLDDREEFLTSMWNIERIPPRLERLLLLEISANPKKVLEKLAQLYSRVSNNIRMHIFQKHIYFYTENKNVENEMIRLIATDLAKRLMTMLMKVGYAGKLPRKNEKDQEKSGTSVESFHDARERIIMERIAELKTQIENGSRLITRIENRHDQFVAIQLRPILCNSAYTISYEPNERGYESAFNEATEFSVLLNMQANVRMKELEEGDEMEEEEEEKREMSEEQQALLSSLFDTELFTDYEKMVEVCRKAENLEQAIEMMIELSSIDSE